MAVLLPTTTEELLRNLADIPEAKIMAGGTDLLVRLRASGDTSDIICLEKLTKFQGITVQDNTVRIGAGTTLTAIHDNEDIQRVLPLLHQASTVFASPLIRNMATIGGNICTASPAGDTLPALYLMDASVELISATGTRSMAIDAFIAGPGKTALKPGETVATIVIPIPEEFNVHHFEKVGQREALAIAVVSMAGMIATENGVVTKARFAWGSVGPTIVMSDEVDNVLIGKKLTLTTLREASAIAQNAVSPISDVRASADYRRQVAGNLLLRFAVL